MISKVIGMKLTEKENIQRDKNRLKQELRPEEQFICWVEKEELAKKRERPTDRIGGEPGCGVIEAKKRIIQRVVNCVKILLLKCLI